MRARRVPSLSRILAPKVMGKYGSSGNADGAEQTSSLVVCKSKIPNSRHFLITMNGSRITSVYDNTLKEFVILILPLNFFYLDGNQQCSLTWFRNTARTW